VLGFRWSLGIDAFQRGEASATETAIALRRLPVPNAELAARAMKEIVQGLHHREVRT